MIIRSIFQVFQTVKFSNYAVVLKRSVKKFQSVFGGNEKWITFVELSSEK